MNLSLPEHIRTHVFFRLLFTTATEYKRRDFSTTKSHRSRAPCRIRFCSMRPTLPTSFTARLLGGVALYPLPSHPDVPPAAPQSTRISSMPLKSIRALVGTDTPGSLRTFPYT